MKKKVITAILYVAAAVLVIFIERKAKERKKAISHKD